MPRRDGLSGTPKSSRTELKLQNKAALMTNFQNISYLIQHEPDVDQKKEMAIALNTYVTMLCSELNVFPDEGPIKQQGRIAKTAQPEWTSMPKDDDGNDGDNTDDADDGGNRDQSRHQSRRRDNSNDRIYEKTAVQIESAITAQPNTHTQHASVVALPVLQPLRLAMTAEVDVIELTTRRDRFLEELQDLEYTIRKNNKAISESFSEKDCIDITNFFFHDIMGPNSLLRLRNLVQCYMHVDSKLDSIERPADEPNIFPKTTPFPLLSAVFSTLSAKLFLPTPQPQRRSLLCTRLSTPSRSRPSIRG